MLGAFPACVLMYEYFKIALPPLHWDVRVPCWVLCPTILVAFFTFHLHTIGGRKSQCCLQCRVQPNHTTEYMQTENQRTLASQRLNNPPLSLTLLFHIICISPRRNQSIVFPAAPKLSSCLPLEVNHLFFQPQPSITDLAWWH